MKFQANANRFDKKVLTVFLVLFDAVLSVYQFSLILYSDQVYNAIVIRIRNYCGTKSYYFYDEHDPSFKEF